MKNIKIPDGEYSFLKIIWEKEPITSKNLVEESFKKLHWEKSTTYTVLKRLSEKGVLKNEASVIVSLIKQTEIQKQESQAFIDRCFNGSLPQFLVAFMSGKKLSSREADRLKQIIDAYKEE